MNEMMRQEPDRLLAIRIAGHSPLGRSGEAGDDRYRVGQTSRPVPIDGIHMGVDLNKSHYGVDSLPVRKGG